MKKQIRDYIIQVLKNSPECAFDSEIQGKDGQILIYTDSARRESVDRISVCVCVCVSIRVMNKNWIFLQWYDLQVSI